jgi:hypothetical protein
VNYVKKTYEDATMILDQTAKGSEVYETVKRNQREAAKNFNNILIVFRRRFPDEDI